MEIDRNIIWETDRKEHRNMIWETNKENMKEV